VRWCFLLTAFFNAAITLAMIAASDADLPIRGLGVVATLFMCWRWKRGYVRGEFAMVGDLLAGVALLAVGFGAGDPIRCAMVLYMGLFLEAMFGTRRRLAIATCIQLGAYGVAVGLSPSRELLTVWSPEVVMQPPGAALVAVMYVLGSTLARHERAAAREHALARVGSELVASADRDAVFNAALLGVEAIVSPHTTYDALLAFGDADRLKVVDTTSENAARLRGLTLDLTTWPTAVRERLLQGHAYEVDNAERLRSRRHLQLAGRDGTAFVAPLMASESLCGALAVMTPASLPAECKDGLQALAMEVALALHNVELREKLAHQALHDPLTDLANRSLLLNRSEHALSRLPRSGGSVAVLLLDVDGFKTVNDSLGHPAGDRVLVEVASRLRTCLRESDTAARLGGDEFAILVEDLDEQALFTVESVAQRVMDALQAPILLPSTEVFVSASIGIAIASGLEDVDELLSRADVAMYAAKRGGKARYSVFEPSLRADAVRKLELETDLRRAVEAGQFVLHYQPIVELSTRAPVGFEALARWNHPRRGWVQPDQFIGLAEESGLIVPVGRWVLDEACQQLRRWQVAYPEHANLRMNVNVAARQLREASFLDDVQAALVRANLSPDALVLEVTETAFLDRSDDVLRRLERLRGLGVHLALDDFGTGYSSLAYLRDLPFDSVKTDKSFVDGVEHRPSQAALIRAIVSLGAALELAIVAEGVETAAQATLLAHLGCDMAQGFLFARPAEARLAEGILLDDRAESAHAA